MFYQQASFQMLPINKLPLSFDVQALKKWLEKCNLWDEWPQRRLGNSPHKDMVDIWVRYNDPKKFKDIANLASFSEKHESVWLKNIPEVKEICGAIMGFTSGQKLGGVLITKLPPGKNISAHIDTGWHAKHYDKYFVAIKNEPGASFDFEKVSVDPKEGDVYAFRNDVMHSVSNNSNVDRIAMIVCIKQSSLSKEGICHSDSVQLHTPQQQQ